MNKKSKAPSQKWLLPFWAGICFLAVLVMVWALARESTKDSPAFQPPPFAEGARQGEPDVPGELGYSTLDAQEYQAALCGAPVVQDGEAVLYLTNPDSNKVWLKVRILGEDGVLLGESGLLRPGEYLETVKLFSVPEQDIPVQLKLMAYEPEIYHSAGAAVLKTTLSAAVHPEESS